MKLHPALLVSAAALFFADPAIAQPITVTGQSRYFEGTTVSVNEGVPTTFGPIRDEAPEGWFGAWSTNQFVPGNMTAGGSQESAFNGADTIIINSYAMNWSGGGGPGTSGEGTVTNVVSFSFNVSQSSTYTMHGLFGSGAFVTLTLSLIGPGTNLVFDGSNTTAMINNVTGALSAGNYALTLHGTGTVSYEGPGGNGSGAAGAQPLLTFVVLAGECTADYNHDETVNSQDFFAFVTDFFADNADFNSDGTTNSQDFFDFLAVFFVGC